MNLRIDKLCDEFMENLEKDYSEQTTEKPMLIPQNEREYWLYTEIWQRCNDFINKIIEGND